MFFQLERAYDKIMMSQLQNRKKGLAFGSFKVKFHPSPSHLLIFSLAMVDKDNSMLFEPMIGWQ